MSDAIIRATKGLTHRALPVFSSAVLCAALISSNSWAQSTPLRPPIPATTSTTPATVAPATSAVPATTLAKPSAPVATTIQAPGATIKFTPGLTTLAQLRALPPNTMIELSNGQKVKAVQFTRTTDALTGLATKKANLKRMDFVFTRQTAVAQLKLNASNLTTARSMAPNTVLELPNGLKLTTAELKKLDALEARTNIRQMLGGNAPAAGGANRYAGLPAIQLKTKADIERLKGKPDSTIVEAPDGTRSTLAELKAALAEKYKKR